VLQALSFLGILILVTVGIHLYLWKRLVRDTMRRGRARRIGGFAVLAFALLVPVTFVGSRSGAEWLAWPGYLWLALMFYLLVLLAVLEIPMLVAKLWLRAARRRQAAVTPVPVPEPALVAAADAGPAASPSAEPAPAHPTQADPTQADPSRADPTEASPTRADPGDDPGHDPDRRLLLSRGAAIFAGLTAAGIVGSGIRSALGPPSLSRVQIPLAKLPRAMDGLRVALVADIHLGPLAGKRHCERVVAAINSMDADVVAIVGDLVDGGVAELGAAAAPLRDLRARHGSYFVTGNHEYYSGFEPWIEEVTRLGVRPLRNERVEIATGGGALTLAGVNDLTGEAFGDAPDFDAALGGRDPGLPTILLAHQPRQVFTAARYGVDLQLSGHTHGGQMVPFNLLVRLQQPMVAGLAEIDGVPVYVTNGAGFWGPPVRVGVPPQVTLVELRTP